MARKRVLITLPSEEYRRLVDLAEAEERAIDQQASLLLKRLLADADRQPMAGAPQDQQGCLTVDRLASPYRESGARLSFPSRATDEGSFSS